MSFGYCLCHHLKGRRKKENKKHNLWSIHQLTIETIYELLSRFIKDSCKVGKVMATMSWVRIQQNHQLKVLMVNTYMRCLIIKARWMALHHLSPPPSTMGSNPSKGKILSEGFEQNQRERKDPTVAGLNICSQCHNIFGKSGNEYWNTAIWLASSSHVTRIHQ